jgi:hypothetical protein
VIAAHIPHYSGADDIIGTVIFAALLAICVFAALRRR